MIIKRNSNFKFISLCLIYFFSIGCTSTRHISFISDPSGATVTVGNKACITPCQLEVPIKEKEAIVSLTSLGLEQKLVLQRAPDDIIKKKTSVSEGFLTASHLIAAPLILGGCIGLYIFSDDEDTDYTDYIKDENSDSETDLLYFGVSLASVLIGGGILLLGENISQSSRKDISVFHITFPDLPTINNVEKEFLKQHPTDTISSVNSVLESGNLILFHIRHKRSYSSQLFEDIWKFQRESSGEWKVIHKKRDKGY